MKGDALGGEHPAAATAIAMQDIDRERVKQAVLDQREEILRYDVQVLEDQALRTKTPNDIERLREARVVLLGILKERDASEKLLLLSLEQLWDAEGTAYSTNQILGDIVLLWPVPPLLGLSATFEDAAYEKRFGFPHHAIDIPTDQGTPIKAPEDGRVLRVSLNGLGYSSIVIEHSNGLQTIYGHITDSLVQEGANVRAGDIIGHTGGEPGTLGAGLTTTGPHLHFETRVFGIPVNPKLFLNE